jgi:hypothetical protein
MAIEKKIKVYAGNGKTINLTVKQYETLEELLTQYTEDEIVLRFNMYNERAMVDTTLQICE